VTAALVQGLAGRGGGYRLVLIGIGLTAATGAVNQYLLARAQLQTARAAQVWLVGSLDGRGWAQAVPLAVGLAVLLPAALALGRPLTLLDLGDDAARALGVRADAVRLACVAVAVGLTALAAMAAGPVAFVALAAPQVARRLTRSPGGGLAAAGLTGALLLGGSDLAAQRLFGAAQLPVGVVTGAVGGVYLAWLLVLQWRRGRG
jgi:iron complex transport system permease protein